MARRDRAQVDTPSRGLSIAGALAALANIDRALDSIYATAPRAVEAMGGRVAIQAISQMTCVGPVPRFTTEEWGTLAAEHANAQRGGAYSYVP